jgi:hypothetical protein
LFASRKLQGALVGGVTVMFSVLALTPAAGAAGLVWSGPFPTGGGAEPGFQVHQVVCPSDTECVLAGGNFVPPHLAGHNHNGLELTIDPLSPGTPAPIVLAKSTGGNDERDLGGAVCPTTGLCLAFSGMNRGLSFNPLSPAGASSFTPDYLTTCGSAAVCSGIVVGPNLSEIVTADPATPTQLRATHVPNSEIPQKLACVSATQCTLIGYDVANNYGEWEENSYNPTSGLLGPALSLGFNSAHSSLTVLAFTCPSATECVIVTYLKGIEVFNPATGGTGLTNPAAPLNSLFTLSCPAANDCVGRTSNAGQVLGFDPSNLSNPPAVYQLDRALDGYPGYIEDVYCPAVNECVAAGNQGAFVGLPAGSPSAGRLTLGKISVSKKVVSVPVRCSGGSCEAALTLFVPTDQSNGPFQAASSALKLGSGRSRTVRLILTADGKVLAKHLAGRPVTLLVGQLGHGGATEKTFRLVK